MDALLFLMEEVDAYQASCGRVLSLSWYYVLHLILMLCYI